MPMVRRKFVPMALFAGLIKPVRAVRACAPIPIVAAIAARSRRRNVPVPLAALRLIRVLVIIAVLIVAGSHAGVVQRQRLFAVPLPIRQAPAVVRPLLRYIVRPQIPVLTRHQMPIIAAAAGMFVRTVVVVLVELVR
jgi:hypothetical protein